MSDYAIVRFAQSMLVASWLLNAPAICKVYLRDVSAQAIVCAATLR